MIVTCTGPYSSWKQRYLKSTEPMCEQPASVFSSIQRRGTTIRQRPLTWKRFAQHCGGAINSISSIPMQPQMEHSGYELSRMDWCIKGYRVRTCVQVYGTLS